MGNRANRRGPRGHERLDKKGFALLGLGIAAAGFALAEVLNFAMGKIMGWS